MRTVFVNGTFHTMEREGDVRGALVVEDGRITGFDPAAAGSGARQVDLQGRHAFPALIDAHLHMMESIALASMGEAVCSFADGRVEPHDLAGVEARVREIAAREGARPGQMLILSNYVSAAMDEGRLPNRWELDAWANGADVWVLNIDGHSGSCSSSLLEALGMEGLAPEGIFAGEAHDANLGKLTGHLASRVTPAVLARGLAHFCNKCASFGIGTVCALEGNDDVERDPMTELSAFLARRMPLDVRLFPQYMDEAKLARVARSMARPRVGGCMRWETDGSVGSRTAAFSRPYRDGSRGSLYFDTDELAATVASFAERGYMVSAHAIGDAAIDQLTGILNGVPGRHRIDHFEFPSADAVAWACDRRPFITVQPGYAWIDKRFLHGYERFLDEGQIASQVPLATLAAAGVPLCGSSDSPVQSVDPFLQMRGMREFYLPEESLSGFKALRAYTANGGEMLGEEKGLLREGWEASFFTCDVDLETCPPSALEGLRARETWLHGRRYRPLSGGLGTLARLLVTPPRAI
ncbi:MAG: amidohydrolase family protein [Eggerthellaceae bacterium]|nr:amidohydrolase family protein [Eggerthellaceae bacterium]